MIIDLTVDRIEESNAVLKTNDNKTIIWPKNKLPDDIKEGQTLVFTISTNNDNEDNSRQIAKDILNEILNSDKT